MFDFYELHKWLRDKPLSDYENVNVAVAQEQVDHVRRMVEILDHPHFVPTYLLTAAIEMSHVIGGADELTTFANQLRNMADAVDRRVKRGSLHVVKKTPSKPANES